MTAGKTEKMVVKGEKIHGVPPSSDRVVGTQKFKEKPFGH
jgi:hypothetical protein